MPYSADLNEARGHFASGPHGEGDEIEAAGRLPVLTRDVKQHKKPRYQNQVDAAENLVNDSIGLWDAFSGSLPKAKRCHGEPRENA